MITLGSLAVFWCAIKFADWLLDGCSDWAQRQDDKKRDDEVRRLLEKRT